jgi:GTP-binding protein Era
MSGLLEMTTHESFRSGFLTLIGRPNAGKSTLINAILGDKIAIVSNTPQTTRHRFRAIVNAKDYQLILVDTPGIHKPHDALGEELNHSAAKALESVDIVAFVLDAAAPFGSGDEWVLSIVGNTSAKKMLVVTKTDLVDQAIVEQQILAACKLMDFDYTIALCAPKGINVAQFVQIASSLLPEGPRWFPADMKTDQALEVMIAEFIREKLLLDTFEEVPHAIGVAVEDLEFNDRKQLCSIRAMIYVEHDSQKGIVIGKGGSRIKHIGTAARIDLEHLLGLKVFLDLRVKVRKDWRRDANQIRRFGYGEGL